MDKTMSPSMTDGQIDKLCDVVRSAVRKHQSEFASDAVQQALGDKTLGQELLVAFRKHVEAMSSMIVRTVSVSRNRTPQEAITATGRNEYADKKVVKTLPRDGEAEVTLYFFNLGQYATDDEAEKEFALRGLKPADPYALLAVNEADPTFADEHSNCTHWKDKDGKWCYVACHDWDVDRSVSVSRDDIDWGGGWWFAGSRK